MILSSSPATDIKSPGKIVNYKRVKSAIVGLAISPVKKVANGLCSNMQTKTVLEALVRRLRFCLIFLISCMNINCAWKKYSLSLSHGLTLLLTLGNVAITYFQSLDHCS
jgi:hypothetical protein